MTGPRDPRRLDLTRLAPEVRAEIESIMAHGEVAIVRSGEPEGHLTFRPAVLEGVVLPPVTEGDSGPATESTPEPSPEPAPEREGVQVVVTTMRMSDAARTRLSEAFGPSYVVLDFADAPATADIVLAQAVSPQLMNVWARMFPHARILVTEILDDELGLDVRGPVGRLLDAGAHGYLPPRPVEQVAREVHGYLASRARSELDAGRDPVLELGPRDGK